MWSHRTRELTDSASVRDADQRTRIYNETVQLFIDGNYLNAKHKRSKIRLQFLGVRVKDPPAGPSNHWTSNVEHDGVNGGPARRVATQSKRQKSAPMDRAFRRLGATMGRQSGQWPFCTLIRLRICWKSTWTSWQSLLQSTWWCLHATNCRNLLSIMERGILPGRVPQAT